MLSKQMFQRGLLSKAKTMWPRSTAIRSATSGCRTCPNTGIGHDVLLIAGGLKRWACPADKSAWARTLLESGSRHLAHNLVPYEKRCGSPSNRPPRPTAQADGALGCVRSGRGRGAASLLCAPVMARRNMSTSASGEGSHDHIESIGELEDASLGLEVIAQLAEELPSTLWSRFYSGSPDFWVNVAYAQELLSYAHEMTGLPWWASIIAVTLSTRVLLFPVFIFQQRVASRLQQAIPLLQAVEMEYVTARDIYKDPAAATRRRNKMRTIYREHACHPWRLGANMLAIGPAFMSFFFGIKLMASSFPDFASGGVLWFTDLAVPDPYNALPVAASLSFLGIMEFALRGRASSMQPMQYQMQKGVQRILCLSMAPLLIGLHYPAGVFVYWITNNAFSVLQVVAFNHPSVRTAFSLPPIATSPPPGSEQEFERLKQKIIDVSQARALNAPAQAGGKPPAKSQ